MNQTSQLQEKKKSQHYKLSFEAQTILENWTKLTEVQDCVLNGFNERKNSKIPRRITNDN